MQVSSFRVIAVSGSGLESVKGNPCFFVVVGAFLLWVLFSGAAPVSE